MKAKLVETVKYIIGRKKVLKKVYDKGIVPLRTNECHSKGAPTSDYSDLNYERRMKTRQEIIRQKCENSFSEKTAMHVTLTFDKNKTFGTDLTNVTQTHKLFNNFIKRIGRRYDGFCYVATFDRQENGNWHYHMMCNLPPKTTTKALSEIWTYGRVDIKAKNKRSLFNQCILYLIGNMKRCGKDLRGIKGYLASHNAKSNIVVSSGCASDKEDFERISEKIEKRKLYIQSESRNQIGYFKDLAYENEDVKEVIIDFKHKIAVLPEGYEDLFVAKEIYESRVRFNDIFPTPKSAIPIQSKSTKSTKSKANKPPDKHTP